MAFTIAIKELGDGSNKVVYVTPPANKIVVNDAMDKARLFGKPLQIGLEEACPQF